MKAYLIGAGLAASMALGAASAGHAAEVQLGFPHSSINSNLYTYTGGTAYPASGSTVSINGIDFTLANFYPASFNAPDVGVVQTGNGGPASATIDTPDVVVGASTTFYSLINSTFGVNGQVIGDLTLNFGNGAHYAYTLTEGDNVRDHYDGLFNNSAPNVFGTATYTSVVGTDRLDAQEIVLPSTFAGQTLVSITLDNTNSGGGNPFIAAFTGTGVTLAAPEPSTWMMLIGGLGLAGAAIRRRRDVAAAAQA